LTGVRDRKEFLREAISLCISKKGEVLTYKYSGSGGRDSNEMFYSELVKKSGADVPYQQEKFNRGRGDMGRANKKKR